MAAVAKLPTAPVEVVCVTVEQAGQLLGISRAQAYVAVRQGKIPAVKLGPKCTRVPLKALEERMNQMAAPAPQSQMPGQLKLVK
jgi:excisionase family DNA binding protein